MDELTKEKLSRIKTAIGRKATMYLKILVHITEVITLINGPDAESDFLIVGEYTRHSEHGGIGYNSATVDLDCVSFDE